MRAKLSMSLLILLTAWAVALPGQTVEVPTHAPWLAYLGHESGFDSPLTAVIYSTPEIILYQDGRMVWLDTLNWRKGDGENPNAWLTARLSFRERSDFRQQLIDSEYFTIEEPLNTERGELPPARHLFMACHLLHKTRELTLLPTYYPESAGARRYVARLHEVIDALRVLTQRDGDPYVPSRIRVAAFKNTVSGTAPLVGWPIGVKPGLLAGRYVEYAGDDARKVVEALAQSTMVEIRNESYSVAWAPVIDIPYTPYIHPIAPAPRPANPLTAPSTVPNLLPAVASPSASPSTFPNATPTK